MAKSFFESIGKKISDVGQSAVEKTKSSTESIRLNSMINEEQRRCNALYQKIGEKYVETFKHQPDPIFAAECNEIAACKEKIQSYQEQIRQYKGRVVCTGCGKELPISVPYCDVCGTKNVAASAVTEAAAKKAPVCQNCGASLAEGAIFCSKCGTKYEPVVVTEELQKPETLEESSVSEPVPEISTVRLCSKCGKEVMEGFRFCTSCGTKVEEA